MLGAPLEVGGSGGSKNGHLDEQIQKKKARFSTLSLSLAFNEGCDFHISIWSSPSQSQGLLTMIPQAALSNKHSLHFQRSPA